MNELEVELKRISTNKIGWFINRNSKWVYLIKQEKLHSMEYQQSCCTFLSRITFSNSIET